MILAVFDVDNVLIRGQSQQKFALFLFFQGKMSFLLVWDVFCSLFLYKVGLVRDLSALREKAFSVVKGMRSQEFESLCRTFYQQVLRKSIIKESADLLEMHKRRGDVVLLLSASLFPLISLLSDEFGISACIATRLEIVEGLFTGRVLGRIPYGEGKTEYVKEYLIGKDIDLARSSIYADHHSDVDVMFLFGNPVAVNPDAGLLRVAKDRGWKVKVF